MPLYQYRCKKCEKFEDIYSSAMMVSSKDPIVGSDCSECGEGKLSRVMTSPNAIVRTGAWATAIRKDQVGFSETTVDDSINRMNSNKQRG
jgi:putative FmdB family regulatory protein|tara:strand:+ start:536 stop:805 length:270 start_codon:yes stop_codon:yes gene_type:complete